MFYEMIDKISSSAESKSKFLKSSKSRYLLASALAGLYVGLGILLIFTIGGILSSQQVVSNKIIMGISFGIALSLVIMAGSELFTGNNMIMTIGSLEKKVSWKETLNVWIYSYIGNFIGSVLTAAMFVTSGLANEPVAKFIVKVSEGKMTAPSMELFVRGIFCNILVCLAVLCAIKLKEETAKLIMIFWCLFAFITTGFEHSIANMTLLSLGIMLPNGQALSIGGLMHNLIPVTLGNMVGGALFIGFSYWYMSNKK